MLTEVRHLRGPQRLRDDLLSQIDSGRLRAGDRLLPLRDLSRRFGVCYVSAQRVVKQLSADGYLDIRGRAGVFATGILTAKLLSRGA